MLQKYFCRRRRRDKTCRRLRGVKQGWTAHALAILTSATTGSSCLATRATEGGASPNRHPARHAGPIDVVDAVVDVVVVVVGVDVKVVIVELVDVALAAAPARPGRGGVVITAAFGCPGGA